MRGEVDEMIERIGSGVEVMMENDRNGSRESAEIGS